MINLGLTGGIACGKSTVRELLEQFSDVQSFDCDAAAKRIVFSDNFRVVAERILGTDAFTANGRLDAEKVADIIFYDSERRARLEKAVHPLVWLDLQNAETVARQAGCRIFVIESALLFETGLEKMCDGTVCIACSPEEQLRRLTEIRGLTVDAAQARISAQLPQSEKILRADLLIMTDCQMDELRARIRLLHKFCLSL